MNAGWHRVAAGMALSLLSPLTLTAQGPQAPVLLRLAPLEGQVSRYALSVETEVDSPMTPSSGPLMTLRIQQTQTVLGVEDEMVRYRTTIDSTTATSAMPGMDIPDLSGSAFTVEFDTRGRMLGVTSTEGLPEVAGLGPESLFQQSTFFVLPEQEVSPGDSWTQDAPLSLPMGPTGGSTSMEVVTTYTFVSLEGSLATLSFEGPFNLDADAAGMGMTGSGTITGMMMLDLAEGRFVSQSSRTSLDMNMAGMSVTSTTTTTTDLIPDP